MNPKLHECISSDDLRPELNYCLVTPDETVATDAHILVVHKTKTLFDDDFAQSLPEKGILLDKAALKSMAKTSFITAKYDESDKSVSFIHSKKKTYFTEDFKVLMQGDEKDGRAMNFPKYADLFDFSAKSEFRDQVRIGLNPKLVHRLGMGMGANPSLVLTMSSPDRAVMARNNGSSIYEDAKGIIMPCMMGV